MASKPDRSSSDELTRELTVATELAIDVAVDAFCSAEQGVVFLEDDEEPTAMTIAIAEAERARGRSLAILWALDRSWLAWHWPADDETPLVGFLLSNEQGDDPESAL